MLSFSNLESHSRRTIATRRASMRPFLSKPDRVLTLTLGLLCLHLSSIDRVQSVEASQESLPSATTPNTPNEMQALNYLLFSNIVRAQGETRDKKIDELLQDSNHSHVSDAVDLSTANSAWKRMRENALDFANQGVKESRPIINRLLDQSNVSSTCRESLNHILDHLAHLDMWAVQMYNSFGSFPAAGFLEGTLNSMGSYHQCVNVDPNEWIGDAQYCSFKFQPIVPKRPRYHNILATVDKLANFTNKDDMFYHFARKSQYFYYIKLRLATCMPSKCEKNDLDRLGKQVAINTYLQYSGVSCLQKKASFSPDNAQIFALFILILLTIFSVLGSLVDLFNLRSYFEKGNSPADKTTTLHGNEGHLKSNQVVAGQQTLLTGAEQKSLILPPPVVQRSNSSVNSSNVKYPKILKIIDILLLFSMIQNGRKLFDTTLSQRQSSQSNLSEAKDNLSGANTNGILGGNTGSNSNTSGGSDPSSINVRPSDISCVHGLRFWTISWIIFGHTMQYTEWAGFARAYQVEDNIVSFFLQPILNATFSVDTFFLISGLLTTYITWSITKGQYKRFSTFAFLLSRYLRLAPQVLLVVLMFIIFPLMGDGPYWRGLIQKESDNCKENWWVSALFLQSFVKKDQICNLVTWWLSIEMFYHFMSVFIIIALLKSSRLGMLTTLTIGGGMLGTSCYLHYENHYPPNMLPTLLQRYEVWDSIVLRYFWTPYPHAPAYLVGLIVGYILYNRKLVKLTATQVKYGWITFAVTYLAILFGTYDWNKNAPYSRITSTFYYNLSQVLWSLSTGWAILACAMGQGGWLNRFLSSEVFIPLGRATYMTYLSHMLIVMAYPAKMNLLIEPSYTVFLYIFISNLFLSYALGITLTIIYESPLLHLQKSLITIMARRMNDQQVTDRSEMNNNNNSDKIQVAPYSKQHIAPPAE